MYTYRDYVCSVTKDVQNACKVDHCEIIISNISVGKECATKLSINSIFKLVEEQTCKKMGFKDTYLGICIIEVNLCEHTVSESSTTIQNVPLGNRSTCGAVDIATNS